MTEYNNGAGTTTFELKGSAVGSSFAVAYIPDWNGNPDVGQYLEEMLYHGQMQYPDSYEQLSEGAYEQLTVAGVAMYAVAYTYASPVTGETMACMHFCEERVVAMVYWTLVASQDDADGVLAGLIEASASFRADAAAYGGASNVLVDPADLLERPATTDAAVQIGNLVTYDDGFFSVKIPEGWTVVTAGEYASFCLEAYDPADPSVRLVYNGTVPFNLNQQTKDMWAGAGEQNALYAMLLVLDPLTVAAAVENSDEITQIALQMGAVDNGTSLMVADARALSSTPTSLYASYSEMAPYIVDESVVHAALTLTNGTPCTADFMGAIVTVGSSNGIGQAACISMWGIVVPSDRYDALAPTLAACVGTPEFTQDYVQESIDAGQTALADALAYSEQMGALMDASNQAFLEHLRA